MRIRTIDDLKGRNYRPATVEGVEYKVRYDPECERPADVVRVEGDEVVKLLRGVKRRVMNILEQRKVKRQGGYRKELRSGDGPRPATLFDDDGFGFRDWD